MGLKRLKQDLRAQLVPSGLLDRIGEDHLFPTLPTAVAAYRSAHGDSEAIGPPTERTPPVPATGGSADAQRMTIIEPGSIVVGADGSPDADRAVAWAVEQAALERRPLLVVTAEDALHDARAIASRAAALARGHRPGVSVTDIALPGDPQRLLVQLSQEAELLVLGSRGRGRARSSLLGSVSAAVSKRAACPVVVCRPGDDVTPTRGVMVGADGADESLSVLEFAFEQAGLRSWPLTVVHSSGDLLGDPDGPWPAATEGPGDEHGRRILTTMVDNLRRRFPETDVTIVPTRGSAEDRLAALADSYGLIVLGRHPIDSVVRRVTGSISTAVLLRSHTNVAVIPEVEHSGS